MASEIKNRGRTLEIPQALPCAFPAPERLIMSFRPRRRMRYSGLVLRREITNDTGTEQGAYSGRPDCASVSNRASLAARHAKAFGRYTLALSEEGLASTSPTGAGNYTREAVDRVVLTPEHLLIFLVGPEGGSRFHDLRSRIRRFKRLRLLRNRTSEAPNHPLHRLEQSGRLRKECGSVVWRRGPKAEGVGNGPSPLD